MQEIKLLFFSSFIYVTFGFSLYSHKYNDFLDYESQILKKKEEIPSLTSSENFKKFYSHLIHKDILRQFDNKFSSGKKFHFVYENLNNNDDNTYSYENNNSSPDSSDSNDCNYEPKDNFSDVFYKQRQQKLQSIENNINDNIKDNLVSSDFNNLKDLSTNLSGEDHKLNFIFKSEINVNNTKSGENTENFKYNQRKKENLKIDYLVNTAIYRQCKEISIVVKLLLMDNYSHNQEKILEETIYNKNIKYHVLSNLDKQLSKLYSNLKINITQIIKSIQKKYTSKIKKFIPDKQKVYETLILHIVKLKNEVNRKIKQFKGIVQSSTTEIPLDLVHKNSTDHIIFKHPTTNAGLSDQGFTESVTFMPEFSTIITTETTNYNHYYIMTSEEITNENMESTLPSKITRISSDTTFQVYEEGTDTVTEPSITNHDAVPSKFVTAEATNAPHRFTVDNDKNKSTVEYKTKNTFSANTVENYDSEIVTVTKLSKRNGESIDEVKEITDNSADYFINLNRIKKNTRNVNNSLLDNINNGNLLYNQEENYINVE